ncbi:MAG: DUF721 domain-containing protein [Gammaproteobacteria bacterium]|nr:DUF721 domain-containing protein [Gammaproteobacteria bacterium]
MSTRNLGSLLRQNPRLGHLYAHARKLQQLQAVLDNHLPQPLASHCRVAALEHNVLTLHTDSPAWAAKLRFLTADIVKTLQNSNADVSVDTIRVKARPPETKPQTVRSGTNLSPLTARLLRDIAETIDDPELRASLLRLSEN